MTSPWDIKKLYKPDSSGDKKQDVYGASKEAPGDTVNLKVLIPSNVGKALQGKHGPGLKKLESDFMSKIEMSKRDDYYPGTGDRVCLISGSISAVRKTHDCFIDVMAVKEKFTDNKSENGRPSARVTVKILVPNSTVSMIIGKRGEYIRSIKDATSVYIQASQKSEDRSLLERCITISGERDNVKQAVGMVLEKIAADPESGIYPNVSYSDVKTALPSTRPTGSPYASAGGETASVEYGNGEMNADLHTHHIANSPLLTQLKLELRAQGYSDKATCDIVAAMYTLVGYELLQLNRLDTQSAESNNAQTITWYSRQMGGGVMMGNNNAKIALNGWVVWPNGEEGRCGWIGGPETGQGYQEGWSMGWNIQEQKLSDPFYEINETSTGASKRVRTQYGEPESFKRTCREKRVVYEHEYSNNWVDEGSRNMQRCRSNEIADDLNQQPVHQTQVCNSYAQSSKYTQPVWSVYLTGTTRASGDTSRYQSNNTAMHSNSDYSMQKNSWSQYWPAPPDQ